MIAVYSTATCPYCKMLKDWLKEKGIEYTEKMVDQDAGAAEEMQKKSGSMSVPVTIIEKDGKEEIVMGFDKEKLSVLLDIK